MNAPTIPGKGWGMRGQALVPLLAAPTLEKNAPHPRVPCEPRRKAAMHDSNGDGNLDLLLLDSTGDGVPNQPVSFVGVDTSGDGRTDCLIADSNGDGRGDCVVLDTSGDGIPDTAVLGVLLDTDNDGQADVLLVDTTGNGVADTFVHIHGVGQHVVHIHGVGQHARGGASSGGFGMHGQQQPPDLMLTSIDEGHQRELLRGMQLTRDFLRTLQQAPGLMQSNANFFVRLNMGSRNFHVAAQIVQINGVELQVRGVDPNQPHFIHWTKLAYVSNAMFKDEEVAALIDKLRCGVISDLRVGEVEEMMGLRQAVVQHPHYSAAQNTMHASLLAASLRKVAPIAEHQESSPIRHFGPARNSPIEFDEAINYVNKIKKTFENYPGTYRAFLEILHKYNKGQKSVEDIYEEVSRLFENHTELIAEFSQFLPDGSPEEETMELEADNGLGLTTDLMSSCTIDLNVPVVCVDNLLFFARRI